MVSSQFQYQVRKNKKNAQPNNPVSDFMQKVQVAWRIFFPEQPEVRTMLIVIGVGIFHQSFSSCKHL